MTTFHTTSVEELADRGRIRNAAPELVVALQGMLTEWDKFARYGSPIAKAGNERVNAARALLARLSRDGARP